MSTRKTKKTKQAADDMSANYDFSHAKKNQFADMFKNGAFVRIMSDEKVIKTGYVYPKGVFVLDKDLQKLFPSAESVNSALRSLVEASKNIQRPKKRAA